VYATIRALDHPAASIAARAEPDYTWTMLPMEPIERVRPGMDVVDESGTRLGTVVRVEMPAPTQPGSHELGGVAGIVPSPADMTEEVADLEAVPGGPLSRDPSGLPDLPDEVRAHLHRAGFIEVEGVDLPDAQRLIAADHIHRVTPTQVVVSASR